MVLAVQLVLVFPVRPAVLVHPVVLEDLVDQWALEGPAVLAHLAHPEAPEVQLVLVHPEVRYLLEALVDPELQYRLYLPPVLEGPVPQLDLLDLLALVLLELLEVLVFPVHPEVNR